jgi:hypothetical protein
VLQQVGPQLLAVLVGLAADEGLHPERVLTDDQPADRLELLGAGQVDQPATRRGVLVHQLAVAQRLLDDRVELPDDAHWATCAPSARTPPRAQAGRSSVPGAARWDATSWDVTAISSAAAV